MLTEIIKNLKNDRKRIVLTEGEDPRILEAAGRLVPDGIMDILLSGDPEKIKAAAAAGGFKLDGMEIADPANYPDMDKMVEAMVELRKGKMSPEECRAAIAAQVAEARPERMILSSETLFRQLRHKDRAALKGALAPHGPVTVAAHLRRFHNRTAASFVPTGVLARRLGAQGYGRGGVI